MEVGERYIDEIWKGAHKDDSSMGVIAFQTYIHNKRRIFKGWSCKYRQIFKEFP